MSLEENKALIRRFVEAVNRGDETALAQLVAEDFTARALAGGRTVTREAMIKGFTRRLKAVPDFRASLIDLIAEGDRVVALGRDTGTPVGEYMGIPATGKSFDVTWIDVYRIRAGQIVEMIYEMNPHAIREQLGG